LTDVNNTGAVTFDEFEEALEALGKGTDAEIRRISFEGKDADGDGALSAEEINDADDS
jgi:Ca2+-binding EF-hand superfamily protein